MLDLNPIKTNANPKSNMMPIYILPLLQSAVVIAYVALIVFAPSVHFIQHIEFHDCQRIIQLLLLSLVLLDATFTRLNKTGTTPFLHNQIKFSFYILIILSIISISQAIAPRYGVIEVTIFIGLFHLALFVARIYSKNSDQLTKQLTYALWVSIALYMVSFYTGYITAMAVGKTLVWPYPFYGFSNIRLFQQYQLWTLGVICLPLLAFNLKRNTRLWLYLALTFWWVLLYYAASRGVIVGWLIAMLATTLVYKKAAWGFLRIQLVNAATGLAAYLALFKAIPAWVTPATAETSTAIVTSTIFRNTTFDRLDLWKAAYVMVKNFPLFGVGPMHFYFYTPHGTHPHNSALQLATEFGIPATLVISLITGYCFYCWIKKFNAKQIKTDTKLSSNLSILLFFTVTASAAYSLVEGVIVMPISQVLMFTMIGLMIGQYTNKSLAADGYKTTNSKSVVKAVFTAMILVLMVLSTMPELIRGLNNKSRVLQSNERAFSLNPNTINPRIWMQQRRVEKKPPRH